MDFSSFSDANFDAKAWINDAIKASKSDGTETFVSSMILKLQLLSQEVSSSFEETSSQTLVRMPRALMEIERMSKEAKNLRANLNTLLQGELSDTQVHTQKSVEKMTVLHQIKQKLDVCTETIAQVAYLQSNVLKMSVVFADGNTGQIGSEISQMQSALQKLKDYPEQHSKFSSTITEFEGKLVNLVEKDCLEALVGHDIPKAQEHLGTLSKIGKVDDVVRQFVERSIPKVIEVWKSYKSEWDFAAWLPTFFAEIKTFVGHEKAYYMEVFGQTQYPAKLTNLIVCILEALDPTFGSRITGMPLPELVKAYCATSLLYSYCCTDLLDQLPEDTTVSEGTIAQLKESLKTVIYHPYLPQQKQYDQLEKKYMQQSIRAFSWVHRVSDPSQSTLTPALVQSISESSSQIFVLAEDGLNRCLEFTQGVESQGFLNTLNDIFVEYSELIGKLVKQQLTAPETVAAATPPKSPVDGGVISPKSAGVASEPATPVQPAKRDSSTVKVGLHLHQMCATMNTKLDKFEMVAKSAIFSKRQEMSGEASPLLRDNPGKATTLAYFLNSMESLKIPVFSLATKHLQLLSKDVEALVFDALFEQIRVALKGIPYMDVWAAVTTEGALVEHPLEYIRSIGDYLFDLPMMILSQAPGANVGTPAADDADDGTVSRYWVDIVVRGCVDLLLQCIEGIPRLSSSGCEQLACDIEYLKDVLTMLSDSPYPVLEDLVKLLHCDVAELGTQLGNVQCPEKMSLYKAIRTKRSPPVAAPAAAHRRTASGAS